MMMMVVTMDCKNSVSTWMDFSECEVNLLTPSLMLGDCFATPMAGDEEKNTSADEYLTFVIIHILHIYFGKENLQQHLHTYQPFTGSRD